MHNRTRVSTPRDSALYWRWMGVAGGGSPLLIASGGGWIETRGSVFVDRRQPPCRHQSSSRIDKYFLSSRQCVYTVVIGLYSDIRIDALRRNIVTVYVTVTSYSTKLLTIYYLSKWSGNRITTTRAVILCNCVMCNAVILCIDLPRDAQFLKSIFSGDHSAGWFEDIFCHSI